MSWGWGNAGLLEIIYTTTAALAVPFILLLLADAWLTARDLARDRINGLARDRVLTELVQGAKSLYFAVWFVIIGGVAMARPPLSRSPSPGTLTIAVGFISMSVVLVVVQAWTWRRRLKTYGKLRLRLLRRGLDK